MAPTFPASRSNAWGRQPLAIMVVMVATVWTVSPSLAWVSNPMTTTAMATATAVKKSTFMKMASFSRDDEVHQPKLSPPILKKQDSTTAFSFQRRRILSTLATAGTAVVSSLLVTPAQPALAKKADPDEIIIYNKDEVEQAFAAIRYELEDPKGGVALMQALVDAKDYPALLEFTKTYDLELRKAKCQQAKKKYKITSDKLDVQQVLNNITFDLIGMNKACRPGQENMDVAQKYLTELKEDLGTFVSLQSTILVQ